jgi:hypothetical protein
MVVHIKQRIYSRDSKISTSTMKRNLCVESWRKSGNWSRSKIRQTETRSDIATLLRAGAESTPSLLPNNGLPFKRLDYNVLDEFYTAPCTYQREGRLHTRDLRPAEALGPDPGPLQGRPRGIQADNGPHGSARVSSSYHFSKSTSSKIRSPQQ